MRQQVVGWERGRVVARFGAADPLAEGGGVVFTGHYAGPYRGRPSYLFEYVRGLWGGDWSLTPEQINEMGWDWIDPSPWVQLGSQVRAQWGLK